MDSDSPPKGSPAFKGRVRRILAALASSPGLGFHLLVAVPLGTLLWAATYPGLHPIGLLAVLALLVLGGLWCVRLSLAIAQRAEWSLGRWSFAPGLGIAAAGFYLLGLPVKLRFALARAEFQAVLSSLPANESLEEGDQVSVPDRIGSYQITGAHQVDGGVLFYERWGAWIDDAGFAYLPKGPHRNLENGNFERPDFRRLGGGWYAWTASW